MASVQYLQQLASGFPDELKQLQLIMSRISELKSIAAIIIQRFWRSVAARIHFINLKRSVIKIQSYFRGTLIRRNLHFAAKLVSFRAELERVQAATVIQAHSRGYLVRKYMKGNTPKEIIKRRKEMNQTAERMKEKIRGMFNAHEEHAQANQLKSLVMYIVFKCHHLIRTEHIEGIYSKHGKKELSIIEKLMKALNMKEYMQELRRIYHKLNKDGKKKPDVTYLFKDPKLRYYEELFKENLQKCDKTQIDEHLKKLEDGFHLKKQSNCHVDFKPRMLYGKGIDCVSHNDFYKQLNVSAFDFILNPVKDLTDRHQAYHIDFWEKPCHVHYPSNVNDKICKKYKS